jgi:hypothetical protein
MRRFTIAAGVLAVAALVLSGVGIASGTTLRAPTAAQVLSVRIDPNDATVGYVTALYICAGGQTDQTHLWVSVKQNASRTYDPALTQDGSSGIAAAWSQSHPTAEVNCDRHLHLQTFRVDQLEQGFGTLGRGWGYVQFCLFGGDGVYGASQLLMPVTGGRLLD